MTTSPKTSSFPVLEDLTARALAYLESLAYAPDTLQHYRSSWRQMCSVAHEQSLPDVFTQELADRFLAHKEVPRETAALTASQRYYLRAMHVLAEFSVHGTVCRRRKTAVPPRLPASLAEAQAQYLAYCGSHLGIRPRTVRQRALQTSAFLSFVGEQGVERASEISASHLSAFIRSRCHFATKTLATLVSTLRSFLRVGCVLGWMPVDLSAEVPTVRVRPDARIPAVWSSKDIEALLAAIETTSPMGKRDRAILLLACRLGMRVGDIRALTLDALKWPTARIAFSQQKTDSVVELPMSDEIASALIDYLRHGRPPSTRREVFLRANAPFEPFSETDNLHRIISRYRRRAGILLVPKAPKGMHTLRHTLATRLLSEGIPLETIGAVLGHKSLDAIRCYTKVDIEALRSAALELQEVAP